MVTKLKLELFVTDLKLPVSCLGEGTQQIKSSRCVDAMILSSKTQHDNMYCSQPKEAAFVITLS